MAQVLVNGRPLQTTGTFPELTKRTPKKGGRKK